ncbi:clavaminate synthase-like protein At3g21360 [Branchiostoma floridae]|uniref:Clavaminate synthase-like protein At3g21360 n=1 Tax=Branchiostoma floridae TaxID=7739 RepID=A0A9J7MEM8_BRAFL|nr:clavaminate synthase-like protein At3g21360 [Branchiostoma floridae]
MLRVAPAMWNRIGFKVRNNHVSTSFDTEVNLVETHVDWGSQAKLHPARIRGRKWLPGSASPNFPEFLKPPKDGYPYVFTPQEDTTASPEEYAVAVRKVVHEVLEKSNNGAVLFRGLPLQTAEDFSLVVNSLGLKLMRYEGGGAVRTEIAKSVYTASDDPSEFCIEPHNELVDAYTSRTPEKIIFFCLDPPSPGAGGETVIADVREILSRLDKDVVDKFEKLGVMYWKHLPSYTPGSYHSWQKSFQTEDRAAVEKYMVANNTNWRWEGDSLSWWTIRNPMYKYRGEKLWLCIAHGHHVSYLKAHPLWFDKDIPDHHFPFHTYYGDGTDIEAEVLQHIRDVHWQVSMGFQLQKGDFLVLNNMYCQHARLGFTGKRKLAVALAKQDLVDYQVN